VSGHDDDRRLRAAFAQLRDDEARQGASLAQLVARANAAHRRRPPVRRRPPLREWLRIALPLTAAATAALVWWIATSAPPPGPISPAAPTHLIALGSLRSPTDVLLAPPLPSLAPGFSRSLIPAPPEAKPARNDDRSQTLPARRFPA
jgi:hypothetical protein